MNIGKLCLAAITAILVSCSAASQRQGSDGVIDVAAPVIPDTRVLLTDFGAVGDGESLATEAFEKGMAALEEKGGGHLDVPAGIWLTGPITLRSHTDLHLDDNAIIVFSSDEDLYPIIDTNFEGLDVRRCLSPINADGVTDISITGRGIIDGSGDAWREVKKRKVSDDQWKVVLERGGVLSDDGKVWFPNEGYKKARATAGSLNKPADDLDELEIKTFLRPVMVSIRNSERILLEGCTFQNSPCWNLHPLWCKDLTVRNVIVRNPHYSANGDGIDIDGCENVLIENSSFDVGDDAICVKGMKKTSSNLFLSFIHQSVIVINLLLFLGQASLPPVFLVFLRPCVSYPHNSLYLIENKSSFLPQPKPKANNPSLQQRYVVQDKVHIFFYNMDGFH